MNNASASWDKVLAKRGVKPSDDRRPASESEAAIRERVHREELQRHKDIAAICDLADKPDRAAGFIAAGKTPGEVLAILGSAAQRPRG